MEVAVNGIMEGMFPKENWWVRRLGGGCCGRVPGLEEGQD